MIRSRLRRPTSKSITAVLWPARARPEEKLALVVVLPTPPLPEVTTTIFVVIRVQVPGWCACVSGLAVRVERLDDERVAVEPHLRRLALHVGGQGGVGGAVDAGDGDQLRLHAGAEDARCGVAARAGDGAAAQRCVDMDVAVGQDLGAEVHRR